ncbi:GNAT family N-acetyltransferase [uncultured Croceitalea sp.]|uniref:GNAT family N-acetyltransferase n=1 Tax=uncultured Croceitalea sp. TaxID=1798908 RepID=UPI00374E7200
MYFNIGRNITNGLYYELHNKFIDYKKKVLLIYDVISYQRESGNTIFDKVGVKKISQYRGYLTRIDKYSSFDDFFLDHYSSSSRMKIRKNERKLKTNFRIKYNVVHKQIDRTDYDNIMDKLFELIEERFTDLKLDNDIVNKKEYYRELFFPMIKNGTAIIHFICNNNIPIAISLSFLSNDTLFYAVNTFDTAYRRYNLGHLSIMNILKWCFENDKKVLDYSKGTYEYKLRWANETYCFENHIIYDKSSLKCKMLTLWIIYYFKFKQFLRVKNINETYVKFKFLIANLFSKNKRANEKYELKDFNDDIEDDDYDIIGLDTLNDTIKSFINDLLYSKPQPITNVTVYWNKNTEVYVLIANGISKQITFKH